MLDAAHTCLLLHPSACCCTHPPVTAPLPDTCDQGDREFYAEVALLTRLRHPNLVCIMGMCDEDGTKLGAPGAVGSRGVRCQVWVQCRVGRSVKGCAVSDRLQHRVGYCIRQCAGASVWDDAGKTQNVCAVILPPPRP